MSGEQQPGAAASRQAAPTAGEQGASAAGQRPWEVVGLKAAEYEQICRDMGREPNLVELQMYGVLWSEHCAYKHSRPVLKQLPTTGPRVLQGPGEGAGVIDLGDGLGLAFKIESHNHPSFVEPFQGAATGVGGILRDVFSMGARPIAVLDSLRFGRIDGDGPEFAKQRYLFAGAVSGIGFYGNCMGIPTVGGEVYFEDSYKGNCLVNAMCAGLVPAAGIRRGIARGEGNLLMVVGARTGRDGIGGASLLASAEFSAGEGQEKRPSVQVGDPFLEKLLLEACLELYETDAVIGIQDCGAAGLTSACCEMAAKGGVGIEIDVLQVPRREEGMQAWEVMISESQERMVVCVERGKEASVQAIFDKWSLESAVIGHVTGDGLVRIREGDRVVAELPAQSIADGAPTYVPERRQPAYLAELRAFDFGQLLQPDDWGSTLLTLLRSPNVCSREWIYRQYDHQVLLNTVILPGSDAALLRIKDTPKGVALTVDCNGRYCYLNPRRGAAIAVAEAARNVVCAGAEPVAITNNLNFGNPEKPEIYWQFTEAVAGIAEACRQLDTPVTGGNVSFYNETNGEPIYPTPTIGMVGINPNLMHRPTMGFRQAGDVIVLIGRVAATELGGSEYCEVSHGVVAGDAPDLDLAFEKKVQAAVLQAIHEGIVNAAHDVSTGGLAVALAEMAIAGGLGCQANVFLTGAGDTAADATAGGDAGASAGDTGGAGTAAADAAADTAAPRLDAALFGEDQSRFVVTTARDNVMRLRSICIEHGVPHRLLGDVTGDGRFRLAALGAGTQSPFVFRRQEVIDLAVDELEQAWRGGLDQWMSR